MSYLVNLENTRSLTQQVDVLTEEIAQSIANIPEVKRLLTIPGVEIVQQRRSGRYWTVLSSSGPKQVSRYIDIDPLVDQSGERNRLRHRSP